MPSYNEKVYSNPQIMRAILENIMVGVVQIDRHGAIHFFNTAASKMFGYTSDEILGENVSVLMPDPFHSQHDTYLANYLNTRKSGVIGIGREVVCVRKDASTFPADLAVSEVIVGDEHLFVGILNDISQRKEAEENERIYKKQLEDIIAYGAIQS